MLHAIESSTDAFGYLAGLLREQPQSFDGIANELLASTSRNPGMWRYLSLYFIRTQEFELAALASENHLKAEPDSEEAFLRRLSIALLGGDAITSQRLLTEQRERCRAFQYACSRFFYLRRFNEGIFQFDHEISRLREFASSEMSRALLREIRVDANSHIQEFSRAVAGLENQEELVLLGNGGSLRGSQRGNSIDSAGLVVRINYPNILDLAEHVGTRTDLVFFTEAFLHTSDNIRALSILRELYPGVPGVAVDAVRIDHIENAIADTHGLSGICLMPVEIRSLIRALTYEFATTGLCAVATLGMLFQRRLSLYGFDFFSPGMLTHFFSKESREVFIGHETAFEKFLVAAMTDGQSLRLGFCSS